MSEHEHPSQEDREAAKELQAQLEAEGYVMEGMYNTNSAEGKQSYDSHEKSARETMQPLGGKVETVWDENLAILLVKSPSDKEMEAQGYTLDTIVNDASYEGREIMARAHEKASKRHNVVITRSGSLMTLWRKKKENK